MDTLTKEQRERMRFLATLEATMESLNLHPKLREKLRESAPEAWMRRKELVPSLFADDEKEGPE